MLARLLFCLLLITGCGGVAADNAPEDRSLGQWVREWQSLLDRYDRALNHEALTDERIAEIRTSLTDLQLAARVAIDHAQPDLQSIAAELSALGPAPATDAPAEAPSVVNKRKAINDRLRAAEGAVKETELLLARSDHLLNDLRTLHRQHLTEQLFSPGPSPLQALWWRNVSQDFSAWTDWIGQMIPALQHHAGILPAAPEHSEETHLLLEALLSLTLLLLWWLLPERYPDRHRFPEGMCQLFKHGRKILTYAIPLLIVSGLTPLAHTLATQISYSLLLAGLLASSLKRLDRILLFTLLPLLRSPANWPNIRIRNRRMVRFWLNVFSGFLLLLTVALFQLVLWGAGGNDISGWLYHALFGFKIGSITLSLVDLIAALALFSLSLTLTRFIQRALDRYFFPHARIDLGLRHSIRASLGYVGFIVSSMLAVSALGLDLSSLAMIAGALSVGIGFGLQNIVNNFVSGLILLVERPIKVGDWIVVGETQGYVKRISVRATEVSTFDQASVFIPNSSLIANAVMNRTYADKIGRMIIPVGVAYGNNARSIQQILQTLVNNHAEVLTKPGPMVFLKEFAESAILFEIVAFVGDVERVRIVSSELCLEIDAVFRQEGLQIPHPQRDVHLKLRDDQLQQLAELMRR